MVKYHQHLLKQCNVSGALPLDLNNYVCKKANEAAKKIRDHHNKWHLGDIEIYLQTVLLDALGGNDR